jgi:hypothetical protein
MAGMLPRVAGNASRKPAPPMRGTGARRADPPQRARRPVGARAAANAAISACPCRFFAMPWRVFARTVEQEAIERRHAVRRARAFVLHERGVHLGHDLGKIDLHPRLPVLPEPRIEIRAAMPARIRFPRRSDVPRRRGRGPPEIRAPLAS